MRNNKMLIIIMIFIIISTFLITKMTSSAKVIYKEKIVNNCQTKEHKEISEIKTEENIVFLGDSITDFYPIDSIYVDLPIVKSGVSGYTTNDILDRMDSMVYQYNPTKVFLLIGTNDIMFDGEETYEETIENIKKIVENIHKNRKNAIVYIESIYPVKKELNSTMVKNRDNDIIKKMNEVLKDYCNDNSKNIYINMYDELKDDKDEFDKKYTNDGLHPNDLGYAKISQVRLNYIYDMN